jgi:hypothetical protein
MCLVLSVHFFEMCNLHLNIQLQGIKVKQILFMRLGTHLLLIILLLMGKRRFILKTDSAYEQSFVT